MFKLQRRQLWNIVGFLLTPVLAVVLTWLTGLFVPNSSTNFLGGRTLQYGFPLIWMTQVPVCDGLPPCGRVFGLYTIYQWSVFGLDTVLYTGIGYAILFARTKRWFVLTCVLIPIFAMWASWASGYLAFATAGLEGRVWKNGFPAPWKSFSIADGWVYNWDAFVADTILYSVVGYLGLFMYKGFKVTARPSHQSNSGVSNPIIPSKSLWTRHTISRR